MSGGDIERPAHLWPCGCLRNDRGAHHGDCPAFETVYAGDAKTANRLDDLTWKPREKAEEA